MANLEIVISAKDQASGVLGDVSKALGGLAPIGGTLVAAAGAGLLAVGAGALYATSEFATFQGKMNEVFTLIPGMSKGAMDQMSGDVRDFATEFGTLPNEVVPALYQAISASVPSDNVFSFLETAQKAAVGGVTTLETAVDGITSVVNAYGADVLNAAQASDLMFTAVRLGKTDFSQLSQSLFNVIPTASALGVEFGDVTAALAAMTSQGTPTSVATTQLRQLFVELSKEGNKTSDLFKELSGQSFADFVAAGGDVQGALKIMEAHAKESNIGINNLFGSVEAGNAALALTGKGAEMFANNLVEMASATGATETAFGQMETGIGRDVAKIKAGFATFVLDAGEMFAPMAGEILAMIGPLFTQFTAWATSPEIKEGMAQITTAVSDFVGQVIEFIPVAISWFVQIADFFINNEGLIIGILAAMGVAVLAFGIAVATAAWTALAPLLPVIAIMAAVGLAVYLLYEAWTNNFLGIQDTTGKVIGWIRGIIDTFMTWVTAFWAANGENILATAQRIWNAILAIINWFATQWRIIFEAFSLAFQGDWHGFGEKLREAWDRAWKLIAQILRLAWNTLKEIVPKIITSITDFFKDTDWGEVGRGIIEGIAKGITASADFIRDAARNAAQAAFDAAKGFLGIKSPSTLFAEIGDQMMQGMAIGIKGGATAPVRAMGGAVNTVTRTATTHQTLNIYTNSPAEPLIADFGSMRARARSIG